MFRRGENEEQSNFWISYADLMAGLLFVFILLIGAIVVKSVVLKSDLHDKEAKLRALADTLSQKETALARLARDLETNRAKLEANRQKLAASAKSLTDKEAALAAYERTVAQQEARIAALEASLQKARETAKARERDVLSLASRLREQNSTLQSTRQRLAALTHERDTLDATLRRERDRLRERLARLAHTRDELNATLAAQTRRLDELTAALDAQDTKYDALLEKLREQRRQIKALTGIRLKVIAALKQRLGDKLTVDKRSGALRLSSKILFDKGSATLKDDAKAALKTAFEQYVRALVEDPAIAPHLDKIVIQGHTDSDGDFLYNLALSQKRALSVMNYLLGLDVTKRHRLTPKLEASGRAYLDAIYDDNGLEDKEASRRIEIKFRLKNDKAMQEIERILDAP